MEVDLHYRSLSFIVKCINSVVSFVHHVIEVLHFHCSTGISFTSCCKYVGLCPYVSNYGLSLDFSASLKPLS